VKVLLWMVPEGRTVPGGHLVVLEQTVAALQRVGIHAVVGFDERPDLSSYDVVNGVGLKPHQVRWCRKNDKPVALSTIYCSPRYLRNVPGFSGGGLRRVAGKARTALQFGASTFRGTLPERCDAYREVDRALAMSYESADLLLPNSPRQGVHLTEELRTTTPWHYVPYGVDRHTYDRSDSWRTPLGDRKTVLYVGRFEPRKNQLGLLRALNDTEYRVVITGPQHPDHRAYWEECNREASPNVAILPRQELADLIELYAAARVHILPSWGETTGLVSLEAAVMGCNVVVSTQGYSDEYFGGLAWYCEPGDATSIRETVAAAYAAPWRGELREKVLDDFTWERTAEATAEGYAMICDG
jgi:glycosyltransferase involved in cell wall biosynthesis